VAGTASAVERPAFLREVPPLEVEGSIEGADGASLPPLAVDELAPGMESLMGDGIDGDEVLDSVVELVSIDVVDLVSWGDSSEVLLPNNVVLESLSAFVLAPEIALSRDAVAVWSGWFRSCLSHRSGFTVLQVQYSRSSPRSRSERSLFGTMKKRE
jgi:hypothetical protein